MKDNSFQFKVYSELYGETEACVLDIERAIKTKCAPCGDGNDYRFTRHEYQQLIDGKYGDEFIPSSKLPHPINLLALLIPSGNRMELPTFFRFGKKGYDTVKSEIMKAGGKYKKNGFEFEEDANVVYDRIINVINKEDYNLKKKYQFFETPSSLAQEMVRLAEIRNGDAILEPSAGRGAIVKAIYNEYPYMSVYGYEIMENNIKHLTKIPHFKLLGTDFMRDCDCTVGFDVIIANPPFAKNQDIDHVLKMYSVLNRGGRLVSVISSHSEYSSGRKERNFIEWLQEVKAEVIKIDAGIFKESGTMVESRIIVIKKPY